MSLLLLISAALLIRSLLILQTLLVSALILIRALLVIGIGRRRRIWLTIITLRQHRLGGSSCQGRRCDNRENKFPARHGVPFLANRPVRNGARLTMVPWNPKVNLRQAVSRSAVWAE